MCDDQRFNDIFDLIDVVVEEVKARIFAALDAMSPVEVRQLVAEIEEELGVAPRSG